LTQKNVPGKYRVEAGAGKESKNSNIEAM